MPELPEVESVVRTLRDSRPALIGRVVQQVAEVGQGVVAEGRGDFERQLTGARFLSIGRHGKYLLLGLQTAAGSLRHLVIHLRMTGRLHLLPDGGIGRHTRLALQLDRSLVLRFDDPRKFGRVWLVPDPSAVLAGLGPDALTISLAEFAAGCAGTRRQLKPLLLDQSFLAGVGNIYADEALHRAGLHPLRPCSSLSTADLQRLHAAIVSVLQEAVEAQGANIDGVFKSGRFIVSVYGRTGQACRVCGSPIAKIRVGQRGTHLCPHCQPLTRENRRA